MELRVINSITCEILSKFSIEDLSIQSNICIYIYILKGPTNKHVQCMCVLVCMMCVCIYIYVRTKSKRVGHQ